MIAPIARKVAFLPHGRAVLFGEIRACDARGLDEQLRSAG
jgi:hypothetical protein